MNLAASQIATPYEGDNRTAWPGGVGLLDQKAHPAIGRANIDYHDLAGFSREPVACVKRARRDLDLVACIFQQAGVSLGKS